jgi:putative alpha-1,2-mannosidase
MKTLIFTGGYFNVAATTASAFKGQVRGAAVTQPNGVANSPNGNEYVGGLYTFQAQAVTSRVGISWISTTKACQNVNDEIPSSTAFSTVVQNTKNTWDSQVLSGITTAATDTTSLKLLYTSLYFMNLLPTNQTGENPVWQSSEPYYSDIFTLWDTFRCSTALMHVLQPVAYEEFIRSMIDVWRHDGYLPEARSSNYNGRVQGGSNADNVLADAFVKGVRGKVNWDDGYAAMVKDAEVTPINDRPDPMAPDSSTKEGRGALPDWLTYGFITPAYTRAASRAVEYAYNDFSLYQVAKGLGQIADAAKYLGRARNWRNHWDPNLTSIGFKGFIQPRNVEGFLNTDPLKDAGYWGDAYYQGSSWAYSWADIFDMQKVVEWMGGAQTFLARLETMFIPGAIPGNANGIIFDATNEP